MKLSRRLLLVSSLWIGFVAFTAMAAPLRDNREAVALSDRGRVWTAPPVDVEQLMDEDEANRANKDIPWRVGFPMRTQLSPSNSGVWVDNTDGSRTWRLEVKSKTALWLVLGFSRFELQPGAELWVLDASGTPLEGPKTSADIRPHGQLWFPPIEGSQLVVELRWPAELKDVEPALHLGTVSHGYREWEFGKAGDEPPAVSGSGSCNNDVACPAGQGWGDQARSVVRVLSGGFAFCSGALINNTANDCTPYVLTAHHCTVNPAGTTFQFNFQNVNCGSGPILSNSQTVTGSQRVASYTLSDFDLLRLDNELPEAFNVFYSGWSRSPSASSRSTGIHHPSGDVKKISHNEDTLTNGVSYGSSHWRISEWEDGTTEPASSGSPLFDSQQRIVGQLHGGTASCSSLTWDEYGKLSVSWIGGGSAASRLSTWLDPLGTAPTAIDGIDQSYCLAPEPKLDIGAFTIDDSVGNGDGVIDPGETIDLFVNLENTGNSTATHIVGTASTSTPQVSLTQGALSWPAIGAGQSATSAVPLTMTVGSDLICGSTIALQVTATAAQDPGVWNLDLLVGTGLSNGIQEVFVDNVESGDGTWTTQVQVGNNPWRQSTASSLSPPTSWYVPEIAGASDSYLMLQEFTDLPAESEFSFWHLMDSEPGFDGGVLEYTTNGVDWFDAGALITAGGYNLTISTDWGSPLAGRSAWSGNLGFWRNVTVKLDTLAGMDVQMRWRFATDAFIAAGVGWFIDNVRLRAASFECNVAILSPPGEVSGPGSASQFLMDRAPTGYFLSWSAPATGGPVEEYRLYSQPINNSKSSLPVCFTSLGNVQSMITDLPDNQRFIVVGANAAGEGSYGSDSEGVPRDIATDVCP